MSDRSRLAACARGWAGRVNVELDLPPGWEDGFLAGGGRPLRATGNVGRILGWSRHFGHELPTSLMEWLIWSDGLYGPTGPLVHPLSAIGPMVPFARVPDLVVQPESWFELGNPGRETVCIDLGYKWPGGGCPIFVSGDDGEGTAPRLIAASFEAWLVRVFAEGGREYWFDPGFRPLGDPWAEHRHRAPAPPLPERLRPLAPRILPLMHPGADDRSIAAMLGVTRGDVEALFRHLQHAATP